MNRRELLKSGLAAGAASILPTAALAKLAKQDESVVLCTGDGSTYKKRFIEIKKRGTYTSKILSFKALEHLRVDTDCLKTPKVFINDREVGTVIFCITEIGADFGVDEKWQVETDVYLFIDREYPQLVRGIKNGYPNTLKPRPDGNFDLVGGIDESCIKLI